MPKDQIQSTWVKVMLLGLGQESKVGCSVQSLFSSSASNKAQVSGCRRTSVLARQHSWRGWRHPEGTSSVLRRCLVFGNKGETKQGRVPARKKNKGEKKQCGFQKAIQHPYMNLMKPYCKTTCAPLFISQWFILSNVVPLVIYIPVCYWKLRLKSWIFPWNIVIFYSYVNIYQRVTRVHPVNIQST